MGPARADGDFRASAGPGPSSYGVFVRQSYDSADRTAPPSGCAYSRRPQGRCQAHAEAQNVGVVERALQTDFAGPMGPGP